MSAGSAGAGEVLVGKKPIANYLQAILTAVARGFNEVVLKARGRNISRAVDVSQVAIRTMLRDFEISNVTIGSEEITGGRRVSTIEIRMRRKQ